MADEEKTEAEAPPKKSKLGFIIALLVALLTLVGGSVAGAVLGPKLLGAAPAESDADAAGDGESEEESESGDDDDDGEGKGKDKKPPKPLNIVPVNFPPLVVDLRDEDGRVRHLKVGLVAELPDEVTPEDFKIVMPRGRAASLSYLRSLTFEEISDPKRYDEIQTELAKRVAEAVGEKRVHRILMVDFVSQ